METLPEITALYGLMRDGGTSAVFLLFMVGGIRRWWVWGWHYDQVRIERDQWKELALEVSGIVTRTSIVAEGALHIARGKE